MWLTTVCESGRNGNETRTVSAVLTLDPSRPILLNIDDWEGKQTLSLLALKYGVNEKNIHRNLECIHQPDAASGSSYVRRNAGELVQR